MSDGFKTWLAERPVVGLVAWADPAAAAWGHDPRSAYAEHCWLPLLGPSTLWLHRRLVMRLEDRPDGVPVVVDELKVELGLPGSGAKHSPIVRAFDRLTGFGLGRITEGNFGVRLMLPPMPLRYQKRLPDALQAYARDHGLEQAS